MKKNQIGVKRIATGSKSLFTIKNDMVYDARGRNHIYCSCTGNTVDTATPMKYKDGEVYCPKCHEKKVEVLKTYAQWKKEKDEKDKKMAEEREANRHMVEMGSDWECGFKFYGLSANVEYEDWGKIKQYFKYYRRGWSRGQELEWNYGEPTGWLTTQPLEVEKILVAAGLIKPENTMEEIKKRTEIAKQQKEEEMKKKLEKRLKIKEEIKMLDEQIKQAFNSEEKRTLSDAEAYKYYFDCTYGKNTVETYTITNEEIIKCENMVDFKYGIAIPYSKDVEDLIKKSYDLEKELLKC